MKVHLCKYCMNNSLSYITQYARYTYYVYVLLILHVISTLKLQKTLYKPPKAENRSEWNGSNLSTSRAFLMECFLLLRLTKFFLLIFEAIWIIDAKCVKSVDYCYFLFVMYVTLMKKNDLVHIVDRTKGNISIIKIT